MEKKEQKEVSSKDTAKRLHLVLMQDRANVSADFLDMMRQEIIEVIKKYIDVDESDIDVRLTKQDKWGWNNRCTCIICKYTNNRNKRRSEKRKFRGEKTKLKKITQKRKKSEKNKRSKRRS